MHLRPVSPAGWWFDAALVVAFVAVTVVLVDGGLLGVDVAVADWMAAYRPAPVYWTARVLNYLGNGGLVLVPITIILAAALAWRHRSVRPLLLVVAFHVITGVTVGPLKMLFDRGAPTATFADRETLFNPLAVGRYGMSYPSGHVANAMAWYTAIAVLLSALLRSLDRPPLSNAASLAIRGLPPAVVFCTTMVVGFHWFTDSLAGLLIGWFVARIMARVPWDDVPLPAIRHGWDRPAGL